MGLQSTLKMWHLTTGLSTRQVPSALLTFSWDSAVLEDIKAAGAQSATSILKPELLEALEQLV